MIRRSVSTACFYFIGNFGFIYNKHIEQYGAILIVRCFVGNKFYCVKHLFYIIGNEALPAESGEEDPDDPHI